MYLFTMWTSPLCQLFYCIRSMYVTCLNEYNPKATKHFIYQFYKTFLYHCFLQLLFLSNNIRRILKFHRCILSYLFFFKLSNSPWFKIHNISLHFFYFVLYFLFVIIFNHIVYFFYFSNLNRCGIAQVTQLLKKFIALRKTAYFTVIQIFYVKNKICFWRFLK